MRNVSYMYALSDNSIKIALKLTIYKCSDNKFGTRPEGERSVFSCGR